MATIKHTGNFYEITGIAADVNANLIFKDACERKIKSILFVAGSDNDTLVIKNGGAATALVALLATPDVQLPAIRYFDGGQYMTPFIDFSECTLNVNHRVVIEVA